MLQNPQPQDRPIDVVNSCIADVMAFNGSTIIGGQFESCEEGTSYFSGYLLKKIGEFHAKNLKISLKKCNHCSTNLEAQNFNLHLFVSLKEYKDGPNSEPSLNIVLKHFLTLS